MSIKLNVTRYQQDPSCCAIAASASVANYYNEDWDYENIKAVSESVLDNEIIDGLFTGEIGRLLNFIGFREIHIVSCDLEYLDYSWEKISRPHLIEKLNNVLKTKPELRDQIRALIKFASDKEYNNKIIIDHCFDKYIKKYLDLKKPVIASFNWNKLFHQIKTDENGNSDDILGETTQHAVVIHGYDKNGVFIIDSHHECYKYKLKKYRNGHYKIKWGELMMVMSGEGDLVVPVTYDPRVAEYELV